MCVCVYMCCFSAAVLSPPTFLISCSLSWIFSWGVSVCLWTGGQTQRQHDLHWCVVTAGVALPEPRTDTFFSELGSRLFTVRMMMSKFIHSFLSTLRSNYYWGIYYLTFKNKPQLICARACMCFRTYNVSLFALHPWFSCRAPTCCSYNQGVFIT